MSCSDSKSFDEILSLNLRSDEKDSLSTRRKIFQKSFHFSELFCSFIKVEYMDTILDAIDIVTHLRRPVFTLMSDVDGVFEHALYESSV
jgi:hypothetical protein